MESPEARVARWVEVVSRLLEEPLTIFPYATIADELCATFADVAVAYIWRDRGRHFGCHVFPPWEDRMSHGQGARWASDGLSEGQAVSPLWSEVQLSIPYRIDKAEERAFLLARHGRDFCDEDVQVSLRLQPLIRAIDTQTRILAEQPALASAAAASAAARLTGRELAVLHLLAEGHTAYGIARRLSSSPRTVQKHLEHVYRKLQVTDRLAAVRIATQLRLTPDNGDRVPSQLA